MTTLQARTHCDAAQQVHALTEHGDQLAGTGKIREHAQERSDNGAVPDRPTTAGPNNSIACAQISRANEAAPLGKLPADKSLCGTHHMTHGTSRCYACTDATKISVNTNDTIRPAQQIRISDRHRRNRAPETHSESNDTTWVIQKQWLQEVHS